MIYSSLRICHEIKKAVAISKSNWDRRAAYLPDNMEYLREWLHGVLQQGGFPTSHRAIPYNIQRRAQDWRIAATESIWKKDVLTDFDRSVFDAIIIQDYSAQGHHQPGNLLCILFRLRC